MKAAEQMISSQPSLAELQNQQTVTTTVVRAMQAELATTKEKQALDHAKLEEEKDGRVNEK